MPPPSLKVCRFDAVIPILSFSGIRKRLLQLRHLSVVTKVLHRKNILFDRRGMDFVKSVSDISQGSSRPFFHIRPCHPHAPHIVTVF